MSRVRRLSIRGIRNFSDEKEAREICFSRPLTLILGPNGTGKTTIIEALKFATSGDFPPGSDNGKYFIYDPRLANSTSVRGVVKLELVNKKNERFVVSRTVECIQYPKFIRMKSLDATITRLDPETKQKVSLSSRCANVTSEIINALGVSKPIINYVLFCHQEDLNWPFLEGQKLKEKFDDIFGTTKFNKALDSIRAIIKARNASIKTIKAEKEKYAVLVREVTEREMKLKNLEERKIASTERIKEIEEKLKPILKDIEECDKKENEYKKIVANEDKKQMEYNLARKEINNLRSNIHKIYDDTTEKLKLDLEVYEDFLSNKSSEIRELELQLKSEAKKEQKLSSEIAAQRIQIGTLQQKMEDHNYRIANRNAILHDILTAMDINVVLKDVSENEINDLMETLRSKFEELEMSAEDSRLQKELDEKKLQQEVDVLRSEKSKILSEESIREKELNDIRKEINFVQSEIAEIGIAGKKLNDIEMKFRTVNNKCDALAKKMDVNATKAIINDEIKKRNELEDQMHKLDEEISLMHQNSSLQAELDLLKSSLEDKEKNIESIKNKHKSSLKSLLNVDEIPMRKLKCALDEVHQKLLNEKENLNFKLEKEQHQKISLETSLKHDERELKKKQDELKSDKAKVTVHCDYQNYDEIVLKQLRKVKALQDDRGMYAYQGVAYKKYLEKVESKDPCCPVCNRGFQNVQEVKSLSRQMKNDMESVPRFLKECEMVLKDEQRKYDTLLQLKPIVEKILNFERTDLKKCRDLIEENTKKLTQSREKISKIRSDMKDPDEKLAIWKNINSDIVLWDQCFDEKEMLSHQIADLKLRISCTGSNSDKTMEEAQQERDSLRALMKDCREKIEIMQSNLNTHCSKIEKAKEERLALQEEKLRLSSNMQKLQQFHEKEQELSTKKDGLLKTIQQLKQKLVSIDDLLETALQKLDKTKKENHESLKSEKQRIDEISKHIYQLNKIQNEIEIFIDSKTEDKLKHAEERVKKQDDMINIFKNNKSNLEKKIASIKEDMTQQELSKRTLMDNIVLRKKEGELETLKNQWEHLSKCAKNFQFDKLLSSRQELKQEEKKLLKEKDGLEGALGELIKNIDYLIRELSQSDYRNSHKNFKAKSIELVGTTEIIDNLKAYSRILDASMIDYHDERMKTVNRSMDRMWKLVYTGTDTSTIQISTSATEGMESSRRTYNYKLIQKKNGVEMDMKGRCSAGQRVLTSIIIRIALAETFCRECSVMALDEPTTNLDEANSKSLAEALCHIVEIRSAQQKNFQLIVISHDEQFICKMSQVNTHKGYYELDRGHNGRTVIQYRKMGSNTLIRPPTTLDESSDDDADIATVRI